MRKASDIYTLLKKYGEAKANLESLKKLGAMILHEVDATKMKFHKDLRMLKFDRIIFNFPHAGFSGKEDNRRVMNRHRQLVNDFFANASHMLRPCAAVHVSHKNGDPFCLWDIESLAANNSLVLTECANFDINDYPGYNNKRGDGHRCDEPFPLGECRTFKFQIGDAHKRKKAMESRPGFIISRSSCTGHLPAAPSYPHEGWAGTKFSINVEGIPSTLDCSSRIGISNVFMKNPGGHVFDACQAFQSNVEPLRNSCQGYLNDVRGNTAVGYSNNLEMIVCGISRGEWLRYLVSKHGKEEEAVHFGQSGYFSGNRQL